MTLRLFFSKKENYGKASLRRKQWNLAEKNATMGIWLGKQYLEQSDKIEQDSNQEEIKKLDEILKSIGGVV